MTPLSHASSGGRDRDLADHFGRQGRVALLRHGPVADRVEAHRFPRFGAEREGMGQFAEGPVLDRDSCREIGADGKPTFVAICEWRSRALSDRFSEAVNEELGG